MAAMSDFRSFLKCASVFALAAGLSLGLFGALSSPANAVTRGDVSAQGLTGLDQLARCLQSSPDLAALLVVDESSSLQDTDPDDKRAQILAGVIDSLSSLAGQSSQNGERRVAVAVSFFALGADRTPSFPWTFLDEEASPKISTWIRDNVPSRKEGQATDYQAALAQARSELVRGVGEFKNGARPCKVIFFFTDGAINVGNSDAETADAISAMCAPGGMLDGIRGDGAALVAIRLLDPGSVDSSTDVTSRELLQGMAEGSGTGGSCGTSPVPPLNASGTYLEGSIDALAVLFGTALGVGAGGTSVPGVTGSPAVFEVEAGVSSFQVVAQAPGGFTLLAPDGSQLQAPLGGTSADIAGTSGVIRWADTAVTLVLPVTDAGIGSWTLTRPSRSDDISLVLFNGLEISLDDAKLVVDEPSTLVGRIVTADGASANLAVYGSKSLTVTQTTDSGISQPVMLTLSDDGTFAGEFTPSQGSTEVVFAVTLSVETVGGQELRDVSRQFQQLVRLPGIYPNVEPQRLEFGALEKSGDVAEATVTLVGSDLGPTKVCFGAPSLDSADPAADLTVSGATGCVDLATGERKGVILTLTLGSGVSDGSEVRGDLPVELNSATSGSSGSKVKTLAVPLTAQILPVPPLVWLLPVLLALGFLLPLLILWAVNWRAARVSLDGMERVSIPVTVRLANGRWSISREDQQVGSLFTHRDFSPLPFGIGRPRRWIAPDGEMLRGKVPMNPFGAVVARVESPRDTFVVSNRAPSVVLRRGFRSSAIDLNPQDNVYLLVSTEILGADSARAALVAYLRPTDYGLEEQARLLASDAHGFVGWSDDLAEIAKSGVALGSDGSNGSNGSVEPTVGSQPTAEPDVGKFRFTFE
jgi:hypothetical protein